MALNNELEGYSHPIYTELQEARYCAVQAGASTAPFAYFRSRNKVIIRAVHAIVASACSAAAGTLCFYRSGVSIAPKTIASGNSVGYSLCITLTTLNTLNTITEVAYLRVDGASDKGKWDVIWEYDVVYPATKIGT